MRFEVEVQITDGSWVKLDLPNNTKLRFDDTSPIFSDTEIPGQYSFPITVPENHNNVLALNFTNNLMTSALGYKPCRVYEDGVLWHVGQILQIGRDASGIKCSIFFGNSGLSSFFNNTQLSAINYGANISLGTPFYKSVTIRLYVPIEIATTQTIVFKCFGITVSQAINATGGSVTDSCSSATAASISVSDFTTYLTTFASLLAPLLSPLNINAVFGTPATATFTGTPCRYVDIVFNALIPGPSILFTYSNVGTDSTTWTLCAGTMQAFNYTVEFDYITYDQTTAVNLASFRFDQPWDSVNNRPCALPAMYNPNFAASAPGLATICINHTWGSGTYLTYVPNNSGYGQDFYIVPCPYVAYTLIAIFKQLGYTIDGDFFTHAELSQLIMVSNTAINKAYLDKTGTAQNFFNYYINLQYHMPGITCGEFLDGLCKMFNLSLFIDDVNLKAHLLINKNLVATTQVNDLTALVASSPEWDTSSFTRGSYIMTPDGSDNFTKNYIVAPAVVNAYPLIKSVDWFTSLDPSWTVNGVEYCRELNQLFFTGHVIYTELLQDYILNPSSDNTTDLQTPGTTGMTLVRTLGIGEAGSTYQVAHSALNISGLVPYLLEAGMTYDSAVNTSGNSYPMRLLFCRGRKNWDSGGGGPWYYCFASNNVHTNDIMDVYTLALMWQGTTGLVANFHALVDSIKTNGKTVRQNFKLSIADKMNIDYKKPILVGSTKGMIQKISYQEGISQITWLTFN